MARKKKPAHGGHGWFVTFADLMGLLMSFFVFVTAFSTQDKAKLMTLVGSMKDAFGITQEHRMGGMIEPNGLPVRDYAKEVATAPQNKDSAFSTESEARFDKQGPQTNTHATQDSHTERPADFASAAASLRQALQELPDITALSHNIMVEETDEGLNIQIIDQDGRAMFPEGSKYPFDNVRVLLTKIAPVLRQLPNRIQITGHTAAGQTFQTPHYSGWELSSDRANVTREILERSGLPQDRFDSVVGKSDSDPLFPDDPFLASNRRISILLMKEAPPLPPGLKP